MPSGLNQIMDIYDIHINDEQWYTYRYVCVCVANWLIITSKYTEGYLTHFSQ